jgi:tetratricopeptide (TPR) repeat protein
MTALLAGARLLGAGLLLLVCVAAGGPAASAQKVTAEISADTSGGFARIVYRFSGDVDANVRMSNGIVVIGFSVPVEASTDRLIAAGYVSAARRDPDGKGMRIALMRKVTLHSMQANDRLFVDLLPDSWRGPPPPLPADVVEELARKVKEAERRQRQMRQLELRKQTVTSRVRVAHQPSFSRYVFELPDLVTVTTERNDDGLSLQLDAPIKFDLADVKASLPATIGRVDTEIGEQATSVKFTFIGKVDVRSFREDNSYVVDVAVAVPAYKRDNADTPGGATEPASPKSGTLEGLDVPSTVPARVPDKGDNAAGNNTAPVDAGKAREALPMAAPAGQSSAPIETSPPSMTFDPAGQIEAANRFAARPVTPSQPANVMPEAGSPANRMVADRAVSLAGSAAGSPPSLPSPAPQAAAKSDAPAPPADPSAVTVEVQRQGDNVKLVFPFADPTSGAVFRRADTLWAVFDAQTRIDINALQKDPTRTIVGATVFRGPGYQVVRVKFARPRLTSFTTADNNWTIAIGDMVLDPTIPLAIVRNTMGVSHATAVATFERPQSVHRITDPDAGDMLLVVTGFAPARGFLKEQEFVEFHVLASTHGIVIQPFADDLDVELSGDKVMIFRPDGLTLSAANQVGRRNGPPTTIFDHQTWGSEREANFVERQRNLVTAAAAASENARLASRLELARFYLAREMYEEAKGVIDVALGENRPSADDSSGLVMRAIAEIMMGRAEEGLEDLASPLVGDNYDAPLWRGLAFAKLGRWAEASEIFERTDAAIQALPVELQRRILFQSARASIETRDFAAAADKINNFDTIGASKELEPRIAVLRGRLAEGLGRNQDALAAYRAASDSADRGAAARGRLHDIALRYQLGEMNRSDAISELEGLTTFWRGDDTEIEALQLLARLYTEEGRYREAFHVMRTAFKVHPNSEMTRRIQDEAAATFDSLFLAGKGDAMPAIDALALFYDFRELTPIGRRGDEMIRRLTDRLVSVDLLDQAAELLQYQVDHRLQGAARAQVAARLAVIYLMNRKPEKALATLRSSRNSDVATALRNQRLLIEARALSDTGRHDVAVDIVSNLEGREAVRVRADAFWAAKRWREAAEQIELLYDDRWKDFDPLTDVERNDLLRAAIGYVIANDAIGLGRFHEKYAAKMMEGPDRRAFEVATSPSAAAGQEFRDVVRRVASIDTLNGFLRELTGRYPETGSFGPPLSAPAMPATPTPPKPKAVPGNAMLHRPEADRKPTASIAAARPRPRTIARQ